MMARLGLQLVTAAAVCVLAVPAAGQTVSPGGTRAAIRSIKLDGEVSMGVSAIARAAVKRFAADGLTADGLGIAVIIDRDIPLMGGYNLERPFYPASVVKLCYAAALERSFQTGELEREPGILADLKDMLRRSSNAATNRILDRLTGTQSGPELGEEELAEFARKRQAVNTYMRSLGFRGFNACQKTWDVEPFGRDVQFLGPGFGNRNRMNAADTARLMWAISRRKVVSREASEEMLGHMRRFPGSRLDIQARRIGAGIPRGSGLWSKAGWTDETNHDAAIVELPDGQRFVLVIFTETSWKKDEPIRWIASEVTSAIQMERLKPPPQPSPATLLRGGRGGAK